MYNDAWLYVIRIYSFNFQDSAQIHKTEDEKSSQKLFDSLDFDTLMAEAVPLEEPDIAYWNNFKARMEKPGVK